ncbi:hypothetical protein, conserved [Babesia bigemina]|uniref:C3H1-type domain-containing protein n=1 Tax=Babesia bigemina TaxID=5866 RepID=A0A061BKJ3_BABBI|nr:hypothetical protein, conserved [Babesia bigemina]CDR71448.1 hypothetical protein, conserved [Babesia bigemina]|eukprot:XP_012770396.1 hypothetical protein, conserved [Babesia bigemina]
MEKLKSLKEANENDKNNPNELLKNLCTGLEKFLGFNKDSKGYDGSGIVYSDLDRLSDGVMGFLSGVLSNIKDHLGQHKTQINEAIEVLKQNKHAGKNGFNDAIGQVVEGVGRYNTAVSVSNNLVKQEVKKLNDKVSDAFLKSVDNVLAEMRDKQNNLIPYQDKQVEQAVGQIDAKLEECKKNATAFINITDTERSVIKTSINDLNSDLKHKLENVRRTVEYESERLGRVKEQESKELKKTIEKIGEVMRTLKVDVDCKIGEDVRAFVSALKKKVTPIKESLTDANSRLAKYVFSLEQWIVNAEKIMSDAEKQVNIILSQIEENNPHKIPKQINEAAEQIGLAAHQLFDVGNAATDKVGEEVKQALEALKTMNNALKYDLGNVKHELQTKVNDVVEAIVSLGRQFNDGSSVLGRDTSDSAAAYVDKKIKQVTDMLEERLRWDDTSSSRFPGLGNGEVKLEKLSMYNKHVKQNDLSTDKPLEGLLPDAIKNIQTQVENAMQAAADPFSGIQSLSSKITYNLQALCDAIRKAADTDKESVKKKLTELKEIYFANYDPEKPKEGTNSIKKIQYDLEKLRDPVSEALKGATDLLDSYLAKADEHYTQLISDHVKKDIQKATDKLTTHARKTYVESIKFLLTEFAGKVRTELRDLPREIGADLKIGFKGFMKDFHVPLTNDLSSNDYTVHKLSYAFKLCFGPWQMLLEREIDRVDKEERKRKNRAPTVSEVTYTKKLKSVFGALDDVLMHFTGKNGYDHETHGKLDKLEAEIVGLKPETFAKPNTAILDSIAAGLTKFVSEMRSVYVSKYDRALLTDDLTTNHRIKVTSEKSEDTYDLTAYGKKCSKVCLTVFSILFNALVEMRTVCGQVGNVKRIYASTSDKKNPLGDFFKSNGYDVATDSLKQDGELRNHGECRSHNLLELLVAPFPVFDKRSSQDHSGLLKDLFDYLHLYYQVCHLSTTTSRKHPSSIYDMLCWLAGLTYSTVHQELTLHGFDKLFKKPEKVPAPGDDQKAVTVVTENDDNLDSDVPLRVEAEGSLDAYPKAITPSMLTDILPEVCTYSEIVLIALLGHGHGDGIYACDFNTNPQGFQYPTNMDTLVCMLCEIVNRLYNQLYFLLDQCKRSTSMSGWRECEYGQGVGGSGWRCNDLSCGDCNSAEKCKRHPRCGVKSPLQSYLEDGLRGFLPHNLDGNSGKLNCPVKSHTDGPCTTPMGFNDISTVASHRYTGRHIRDVLAAFCGTASSPLTALCSMLRCVLPSAPKTFDQMFAFFQCLLVDWNDQRFKSRITHREEAFNSAVIAANFENPSTQLEIAPMFGTTSHKFGKHADGALYSLLSCNPSSNSSHVCGPYMKPICSEVSTTFTVKHADRYLSSVLYLTESFYNVLQQLFEECNSKCGKPGTRCSTQSCAKGCERQQIKKRSADPSHDHACISVVSCQSTLPILYKYGFIFNDAESLNGAKRINTKRTCVEFCKTLGNVVKQGSVLYNLVHRTIPEFLFTIRAPFIWLNVALWLLSLLYLTNIMVIRLDLLHIKSHLHSPSSHRIAAQSLLAAGRVNKLNRVFYLQP